MSEIARSDAIARQCVRARIFHARRSGAENTFEYGADFVLVSMLRQHAPLWPLFARNGFSLFALHDRDHGAGLGDASAWACAIADAHGLREARDGELWLLTQPRQLGFVFNPVSFWFFTDACGRLRAVLAEVNNTFGERHAYFCRKPDQTPIGVQDTVHAAKAMRVSPFQHKHGAYAFQFEWRPDFVGVRVEFRDPGGGGMVATLTGARQPMTASRLLGSVLRWPFGSLRVVALIGWQAIKLIWKGERSRRPERPLKEVAK